VGAKRANYHDYHNFPRIIRGSYTWSIYIQIERERVMKSEQMRKLQSLIVKAFEVTALRNSLRCFLHFDFFCHLIFIKFRNNDCCYELPLLYSAANRGGNGINYDYCLLCLMLAFIKIKHSGFLWFLAPQILVLNILKRELFTLYPSNIYLA